MAEPNQGFDAEFDALPSASEGLAARAAAAERADRLGVVIGGSLSVGPEMGQPRGKLT